MPIEWCSYTRNSALSARGSLRPTAIRAGRLALCLGAPAAAAAGLSRGGPLGAAVEQTWPSFALVTGLVLIGGVAAEEGLFAAVGARLARASPHPLVLLLGMLVLDAVVTVVLNLDTAVVFLTPVLIEAARDRDLDERPFLYGTVFTANSASLLLPGSNLTNLLVVHDSHLRGLTFASHMGPPFAIALAVTWVVVAAVWGGARCAGSLRPRTARPLTVGRSGSVAILAAAALVLLLPGPALPVLGVALAAVAWRARPVGARRGAAIHRARSSLAALDPVPLAGLFLVATAVGTLAHTWPTLARSATTASPWAVTAVAALTTVLLNNLPAAALLASSPAPHPFCLLLGLDLAPNAVVTGSLSALLWRQVARRHGAATSIRQYSGIGGIIAVASICATAPLACR